ncbi:unnamed protein product, partial [Arabidopsis halleri]
MMVDSVGEVSVPVSSQSKEVPSPKSYANVVGSRPSLAKFDVNVSMVDGKATVAVPDAILDDPVPLWEDFLIGRFPSTTPHVAKIHVIVNKIWNLGDKSTKIDVYEVNSSTVKFRIRNVSARTRALRRGMWNICEQPMMMSKWTPIVEDAQPEIKTMPMWVKIKNVPHSMFTWPGLSFLANRVGEPRRLHPDTELVTSFDEAKIFVEADLLKELPKIYYFQVRGEEVCVEFEYPWLPQKCGICKKWGHPDDGCLANSGRVGSPKASGFSGSSSEPQSADVNVASVTKVVTSNVVVDQISPLISETTTTCREESVVSKEVGAVEIGSPVSQVLKQSDQIQEVKENRAGGVKDKPFGDWSLVRNYEFSRLGRVWVIWSKGTQLQVVFKSGQMITCNIKLQGAENEFWCSFIYAFNTSEERRELWRDIQQQHDLAVIRGKPWMVLGDFNETLDLEEHSNSATNPMVTSRMRDFQDV